MRLIIDIPNHVYEHAKNMSEDSNDEYAAMRAIAKAEKERPHGEWIKKTEGLPHLVTIEWVVCSECGVQKSEGTPFCPNCGAKMGGEAE